MSNPKRFLAFDTETGGVKPKINPILTAYFAVITDDFSKIDELYLKIRPSEPYSIVEEDALAVNKIDLTAHIADPETLDRPAAAEKLKEFLKKHKGKGKYDKPIPLGHNIEFDVKMIVEQLLSAEEWDEWTSYANRDTKRICDGLKDMNLMPPEIGNLGSLVKHFQIPMLEAHTAKDDTWMAIECYRRLIEYGKSLSQASSSSGLTLDMLDILEK